MGVSVVLVRKVVVFVRQGFVGVAMGVPYFRNRSGAVSMGVPVMLVMFVLVFVLNRFVGVRVDMPLGEMEPHSNAHEESRNGESPGQRLS